MAATDSFTNTVPLGEAGTGAAYILPQSQAIANIGNYIDSNAAAQAKARAQQIAQAQATAAAWQKNQLNIKGGTLFQPEINSRAAKVMQMGINLQKAGVNPNLVSTDPKTQQMVDDYHTQKNALLSDVDVRDQIVKQSAENEKLLAESPAGTYDPSSVDAYHQYISGQTPLSQITGKGLTMPALRKSFDLNKFTKDIPTVPVETTSVDRNGNEQHLILPNSAAHQQLASTAIDNSPEAQADISNKTGVPYGLIPNTTDASAIKQTLDNHYRSAPNIPSLAAQGINTFGTMGPQANANSNGVPDATVQQNGVSAPQGTVNPQYDQLLNTQANKLANAAKLKQSYIQNIADQKDAEVHQANDQKFNFAYQQEQDRRERLGMERMKFGDWLNNQQNEKGQFSLGNQDSYVPVIKVNKSDATGQTGQSFVEPEKGAALFGVNLPKVATVVRPSLVTNMSTGKTVKNTAPLNVDVSQIQTVPVWKGLANNDPRNGSELSAKQLQAIISGQDKSVGLDNISFQPFAYGIQHLKDANDIHSKDIPVKFSYDALKGSNVKKINTSTFDEATNGLKQLQANPKFQALSPQDKLDFISQRYNLKLD